MGDFTSRGLVLAIMERNFGNSKIGVKNSKLQVEY